MPATIQTCQAVADAQAAVEAKQVQVDEMAALQAAVTGSSVVRITVDVLDPANGHVAVNGIVEVKGPQVNGLLTALAASTAARKSEADQDLADALTAAS